MKKVKEEKAITLISVIVTIIVLIILSSISIAMLGGDNGIITQAEKAKRETKIQEYKEALEAIRPGLEIEGIQKNWDSKKLMDRYEEEIGKNERFKDSIVTRKSDYNIQVETKEGYIYNITEDGVEYKGKRGEEGFIIPPNLQEGDIELDINPKTWTREVKVSIISKISGYGIQYSFDVNTWIDYKDSITIDENCAIYVRLVNAIGETGESATGLIENIDRENPQNAEISINGEVNTPNGGNATVVLSDNLEANGVSGIDIENCKFEFNTNEEKIGIEEGKYTGEITFDENQMEVTGTGKGRVVKKATVQIPLSPNVAGQYYLHILTKDVAGNYKETISEKVEVIQLVTELTIIGSTTLERTSTNLSPKTTLSATVKPDNAKNKTIVWESSNTEVAIIDKNTGEVTAKKAGSTTITAKTTDGSNISKTCEFKVTDRTVSSISVTVSNGTATSATLTRTSTVGTPSIALKAVVTPSDAIYDGISWSSADTNVATVAGNGANCTVTTKGSTEKTLNITASAGGKSANFSLTVNNRKVSSISVTVSNGTATSATLTRTSTVGTPSITLKAVVTPSDAIHSGISWSSSDTNVATVAGNGTNCTVTTKGSTEKTLNITVSAGGKSANFSLTVNNKKVTSITLTPPTGLARTTSSVSGTVTASVQPTDAYNKNITYSSNNGSLTVSNQSEKGCTVTANARVDGAVITAKAQDGSNVSKTCSVSVVQRVTSITLSPANKSANLNTTVSLSCTVKPDNANNKTYTLASSNTGIAQIGTGTNVAIKGVGSSVVTATAKDRIKYKVKWSNYIWS